MNNRAEPGIGKRSYDGHYMKTGREAEAIVMTWLRNNPHVIGLDDLRHLREMRTADVDCSLRLDNGTVALVEIKSDYHLGVSGNILIEVLRINHTAPTDSAITLGWFARSPATWLLYYAPQVDRIYQCRFNDLRYIVQRYTQKKRKNTRFDYINTDTIKSTVNILIPYAACEGVFTVHDLRVEYEIPF